MPEKIQAGFSVFLYAALGTTCHQQETRQPSRSPLVWCRIRYTSLDKTLPPETTAVASAASFSVAVQLVTRHGKTVINTDCCTGTDDVGFAHLQQRCFDLQYQTFNTSFGRKIGKMLKGSYEFRPTIRVPGIIQCVDTDEY
jgi:hypothetical protein